MGVVNSRQKDALSRMKMSSFSSAVSPGHEGGLVGALHRGKSLDYSPILNAAKQALGLCVGHLFSSRRVLDGHICSSRGQGFGGVVGLVFHGLVCKRERKELNFQTQKACVQMLSNV